MNQPALLNKDGTGISLSVSDIAVLWDEQSRCIDSGYIYPGRRRLEASDREGFAKLMGTQLTEMCAKAGSPCFDFDIRLGESVMRGAGRRVAGGKVDIFLRHNRPLPAPDLETLIGPAYAEVLMAPKLCGGGIVIVCGETGSGKSTTMARMVIDRLTKFGGVAHGFGYPLEYLISGEHGMGVCYQVETSDDELALQLKHVLRCMPVATAGILFINEIRDAEAVRNMFTAAQNGFLVVFSMHSHGITAALQRLLIFFGQDSLPHYRSVLGDTLRLVVYQRLRRHQPKAISPSLLFDSGSANELRVSVEVELLYSNPDEHAIGEIIRSGRIMELSNLISAQNNRLRNRDSINGL